MAKKTYPDFGKWLTYAEAIKSTTAIRLGIDNTPTQAQYNNMKRLYDNVYAPLCDHFGYKLPVSSFFRTPALNSAVGGSSTSDHPNGNAIDIDMDGAGRELTNKTLFAHVKSQVDFDQLLWEYGTKDKPEWVHIGYRGKGKNRKQVKYIS
ncbi:D-Ala-D-Ala carboxypeptidase family metallohydrolase [Spirosoma sordidisoli]|uniref:Peptidase M15 n=1 Tax=Spirosoma sordidisoli TaxID=2502893 RepID=A0A4Q2USC0_9BACT|nr:D-Ala-D-Ala carboxypeptidase family metallohydrolase [Spirosoma sordidisoli]RYC70645.1 peptidase M15 [Spirosoma sordidisoli]